MGYDYSPNEEAGNTAWVVLGGVGALTATSVAALPASSEAADAPRRLAAPLWVAALLIILAFLVVYPLMMLVFGAFSDSNPVVDGFGNFKPSVKHFVDVLGNENVHLAFFNALAACGGGTILAVVIGLAFSWIVVRTNTPAKGFIAGASMIPLFVPPLVAGVAWGILGSPKTGLLNIVLKWLGIDFRFNFYSMSGLIVVFGIYYAPYVYMFTASALRNMDPSLEEAAEVSGASAFTTLFTVTFPLIAPAILAGSLLSFVVMLGIYGVPAALGAPANINVLTTYIFKLTAWSPPLYNTAAAVAILLMMVTAILVWAQQRVLSGKSFATVAGKAFRPRALNLGRWRWFTFGLAMIYLFIVVVLPTLALVIAAFRKFLFIQGFQRAVRHEPVQPGALQQRVRQPAHHAVDLEHAEGRRDHGRAGRRARLRHRLHRHPDARGGTPRDRPAGHPACRHSRAWSSASPICGRGSACRAASTAPSGSWRWPSSRASCPTR